MVYIWLYLVIYVTFRKKRDIVAEWLRRWIANPLLFEHEISKLSDVERGLFAVTLYFIFSLTVQIWQSLYTCINFYAPVTGKPTDKEMVSSILLKYNHLSGG